VSNPAVAGHAFDSLLRAAALNLSNMENLEWLTGQPRYDDGPVINSRRQIWSVAGYLSAVAESVFGWRAAGDALHIQPFLTSASRRALGDGPQATLSGLAWPGMAAPWTSSCTCRRCGRQTQPLPTTRCVRSC
jgi:hypothetical protein